MGSAPGLHLSRDTFAKLTPGPFLHAHLKQSTPIRPNGRKVDEFRQPTINTGSLTHSNGSAVVRLGDTAVVCGIRGEILLASNIPHPPSESVGEDELVEQLGLLVPNVELSTGCSPAHLPGNPPSSMAQALSYRVHSLLNDTGLVSPSVLSIVYAEPDFDDDDITDSEPRIVTKAYWALYIDILCIALDGNAFDTVWLAVTAALNNTVLPKARWDPDLEKVICSPLLSDGYKFRIPWHPVASSFTVFTTASPLKKREVAESWLLADPDAFEEETCNETITVVLASTDGGAVEVLRLEKGGGTFVGKDLMQRCIEAATIRKVQIEKLLTEG